MQDVGWGPFSSSGPTSGSAGYESLHEGMQKTDTQTSRYTLDIQPSPTSAASFQWSIRDRGKLIQRSDRLLRTEADARKKGQEELERILHPRDRH